MGDHELRALKAPLRTKVEMDDWYEGLDGGIRFPVRVLHSYGIETSQSCQGGDGHAYDRPTVDLAAGPESVDGFAALAHLAAFGLPVADLSLVWDVTALGLPYQAIWRVTFTQQISERADERPGFLWGYQSGGI